MHSALPRSPESIGLALDLAAKLEILDEFQTEILATGRGGEKESGRRAIAQLRIETNAMGWLDDDAT